MKSPQSNEFLTDEEDAVTRAAYAQVSVLESAAAFAHVVEKLEFAPDVQAAFTKNLQRCINAIASAVPNQWRHQVLQVMSEATDKVDEHQAETQAPAESAEQPTP